MTEIAQQLERRLTDDERTKFLALVRENPDVGHVAALRQVGVDGTKGYLSELLAKDPDIRDEIAEARHGTLIDKKLGMTDLLDRLAEIVHDKGNPKQLAAIERVLAMHGEHVKVDVNHTGEVQNPDVAAAIDRFTALADAAIRAASRTSARQAAIEP